MFGIAVSRFYAPVLEKHPRTMAEIGFDPNNGIARGQLEQLKKFRRR